MENVPDPATPSVSTSLYTTANASTLDANSTVSSELGDSILILENPRSGDSTLNPEESSNATICLDSSGDITNSSVVELSKSSTPIAHYSSKKNLEESIDGSFSVVIDDGPEVFNPSSEEDSELDLEDEAEEAVEVNDLALEGTSVTLPETVTLLTTPEGGCVYLVGTAHFSKESQEDVAKVIQTVQPHVVLVELCKARVNILQLDEQTILEEAKNINFEKIKSTIQQNGLFHGIMNILLLSMSAHLTKELGMAPGGEFRRAFSEAKKVPNCVVHLGDRPIKLTLQRALASLSWWQTLKLTWHIMSKESIRGSRTMQTTGSPGGDVGTINGRVPSIQPGFCCGEGPLPCQLIAACCPSYSIPICSSWLYSCQSCWCCGNWPRPWHYSTLGESRPGCYTCNYGDTSSFTHQPSTQTHNEGFPFGSLGVGLCSNPSFTSLLTRNCTWSRKFPQKPQGHCTGPISVTIFDCLCIALDQCIFIATVLHVWTLLPVFVTVGSFFLVLWVIYGIFWDLLTNDCIWSLDILGCSMKNLNGGIGRAVAKGMQGGLCCACQNIAKEIVGYKMNHVKVNACTKFLNLACNSKKFVEHIVFGYFTRKHNVKNFIHEIEKIEQEIGHGREKHFSQNDLLTSFVKVWSASGVDCLIFCPCKVNRNMRKKCILTRYYFLQTKNVAKMFIDAHLPFDSFVLFCMKKRLSTINYQFEKNLILTLILEVFKYISDPPKKEQILYRNKGIDILGKEKLWFLYKIEGPIKGEMSVHVDKVISCRKCEFGIKSCGDGDEGKGDGNDEGGRGRRRSEAIGKGDQGKGEKSEGDCQGAGDSGKEKGDIGGGAGGGEDGEDGGDRQHKNIQEIDEDVGDEEEVEEDVALERPKELLRRVSERESGSDFTNETYDENREAGGMVDNYEHPLPDIFYIPNNVPGPGANMEDFESAFKGCSCSSEVDGSCSNNGSNCFCVARSLGPNYDEKGLLLPEKLSGNLPVFECSEFCSCACSCGNRKVQFGPLPNLCVFESIPSKDAEERKTTSDSFSRVEFTGDSERLPSVSFKFAGKGLGLRTLKLVPKGTFICEYAGEVLGKEEAVRRWKNDCSQGLSNYILALFEWCSQPPPRGTSYPSITDTFQPSSPQSKDSSDCASGEDGKIKGCLQEKNCLVTYIDPTRVGNIGRYANHSCDPNAASVPVRVGRPVPCLCLFAVKDLMPGDEVAFDYAGLDKSSCSRFFDKSSQMPKVSQLQTLSVSLGDLDSPLKYCVAKSDGNALEEAPPVEEGAKTHEFKESNEQYANATANVHSVEDISRDGVYDKPKMLVPMQKYVENKSVSPISNKHKAKCLTKLKRSSEMSPRHLNEESLCGYQNAQRKRTLCLCGTKNCRKYLPFSGHWI